MIRFQVSGIVEREGGTELSYRLLKGTVKKGVFAATACVYQDTVNLGKVKPEEYPARYKQLVDKWLATHKEVEINGL